MSLVPVPEGSGLTQPVKIRFLQVNASADGRRTASGLYFDSMAYAPGVCAHGEALAGCAPAASYYATLLDNHFYWEATWEREGRLRIELPHRPHDTDGALLLSQAHSMPSFTPLLRHCPHHPSITPLIHSFDVVAPSGTARPRARHDHTHRHRLAALRYRYRL
jgi:hypothetical protein